MLNDKKKGNKWTEIIVKLVRLITLKYLLMFVSEHIYKVKLKQPNDVT